MVGHLVDRLYGFAGGVGVFGTGLGVEAVVPGCYGVLGADSGMMVKRRGSEGLMRLRVYDMFEKDKGSLI